MLAGKKNTAGIALIDFCRDERGHFWQQRLLPFLVHWRQIGVVRHYRVLHYALPWREEDFAELGLLEQQRILKRVTSSAVRQGSVLGGLPLRWRKVLPGDIQLEVPFAAEIALDKAIYDLATMTHGLEQKKISLIGVNDRLAKSAADKLLERGAMLILSGRRASSLADWYYRRQGLALPVFRTAKAFEEADGILSLAGDGIAGYAKKTIIYGDLPLELCGSWQEPFKDGRFPAGLAAPLLAAGAKSKCGLENKQTSFAASRRHIG